MRLNSDTQITGLNSDSLTVVHKHASVRTIARLAQTCKQLHQDTMDATPYVELRGETGLAYLALEAPPAYWRIAALDLAGWQYGVDVLLLASLSSLERLALL